MSLERIVRPFQTGDISPAKPRPISDATATQNNVIIYPGHNGTVKTFSGNYNLTVTFYFIKKPVEKKKPGTGTAAQNDPQQSVANQPAISSQEAFAQEQFVIP